MKTMSPVTDRFGEYVPRAERVKIKQRDQMRHDNIIDTALLVLILTALVLGGLLIGQILGL